MNVKEIVIKHLREIGADGLCRYESQEYEESCGCGIDDLAPCGEICQLGDTCQDCVPARRHEYSEDSHLCDNCETFDVCRKRRWQHCYVPLEEKP